MKVGDIVKIKESSATALVTREIRKFSKLHGVWLWLQLDNGSTVRADTVEVVNESR